MIDIILNQKLTDENRRKRIYAGDIFLMSSLVSCSKLCNYAIEVLREKFQAQDPQTAFLNLPVQEFVKIVEKTKNQFTNSLRSKELIREFLIEMDSDPLEYCFDVPRIRVVPNYAYLHAGVSYAYAPHRDTWYGSPTYQINHWMPIFPIMPEQTMAIYPAYFSKPVQNSSENFDLERWTKVERKKAVNNIEREERVHPLPLEDLEQSHQVRIGGNRGDIMIFSGTHLHATVPNLTQLTRFSIDFRIYNKRDIAQGVELLNIDSQAQGVENYLKEMFNASDFSLYSP
ncbi:MAG: hypothetical protein LH649_07380 [Pseudanabaena sp. CAN_BIN31]|nr:hypothetical protein [Pseudanabaena sp. CAN_BIN31]